MGRFELYHFLSDEEGDVDLFNGMLDRETCDEAIEHLVDEPTDDRRLVHLRPRADDGRRGGRAARPRRGQGSNPYRALHRRPAVGCAGGADGRSCRKRRLA